ncbi:hypothetical protein [Winogradskyella forsetii]|uniref:hypothetical protein n=1 Tax=Winogradskyella forsetii TaxID=2686077 RepID=UPI0015B90E5E|nr:hypothetical protein [Winogradskyella forsetii]
MKRLTFIAILLFTTIATAQLRGPDTFKFRFIDIEDNKLKPVIEVTSSGFQRYKESLDLVENEIAFYDNHSKDGYDLIVATSVFLPIITTILATLDDKEMKIIIFNYDIMMPEYTKTTLQFMPGSYLYQPAYVESHKSVKEKIEVVINSEDKLIPVSEDFVTITQVKKLSKKQKELFQVKDHKNARISLSTYSKRWLSDDAKGKFNDAILPYYINNEPKGYVYLSTKEDDCEYVEFTQELLKNINL